VLSHFLKAQRFLLPVTTLLIRVIEATEKTVLVLAAAVSEGY
jgi:hypothetical protein